MAKKGEVLTAEAAAGAGAVIVQAGAVLVTINPATVVAVAGAVVVIGIGGAIAYAIGTRGKSVKFKVDGVVDVEAKFH
jgi:hypothetical protein